MFKIQILCYFLFSTLSVGEKSQEHKLIQTLFQAYDKNIRPALNSSRPVLLKLGITLVMIYDLDEKNEILTTILWMNQEWRDEKLTWKSSQFEFLDKIRVPCGKIWLPDIVLYNSVQEKYNEYHNSLATVYNNGKLLWKPMVTMYSSCRLDISYFPFDDQICVLKLGSWAYSNKQLEVKKLKSNVDLSSLVEHGEWNIFNTSTVEKEVFHQFSNETYSEISFYFQLKRRNLYYIINVTFPCILLSFLTLVGFVLPSESGEKVTLSLTVLLLYSVFLLMVTEKMPATSEFTPLIGIYITINMGLTSVSVIIVVLIINVHHKDSQSRSNSNLYQSVITNLNITDVSHFNIDYNSKRKNGHTPYSCFAKSKSSDSYRTLARRIDKYVGIIFSIFTIINTLFLIVVKPIFREDSSKLWLNIT